MVERECNRARTVLVAAAFSLAACGSGAPEPDTGGDIDPANASYAGLHGFADGVTLIDGKFEGEPVAGEDAGVPAAYLSRHLVQSGDLDGDGVAETAAVVITSAGESAAVAHLALLKRNDQVVENVATRRLGNLVRVRELEIRDGALRMTSIEHGPSDPTCCPSQRLDRWFDMSGGALEMTSEAAAETLDRTMGFVSWDDARAHFVSCDESRSGAVLDGMRDEPVRALYDELASDTGQSVFFDVEGRWLNTAAAGLDAPDEKTLEITDVYRVEREGQGCGLEFDESLFLGFGSEPAWLVDVRRDGAVLASADRSENVVFEGDGQLAARQFEFQNDQYLLRLSYLELPCRNPVSGSYFSHTVEFTIGGSRFRGCAVPGR